MTQPLISQLDTWAKYEERILKVLSGALALMRATGELPKSEVKLNRLLYGCLLEANRTQWKMGEGFDHPPTCEGKNPPDPDDEHRAKREDKIPDFYWSYIDHMEPDPRRGARHFFIECKRLGKPPSSNWVLNRNYVQKGILRFVREDHGYAKGEKSGAMVGYLQSMQPDDILAEVNLVIESCEESIPLLHRPLDGWQKDAANWLEHTCERRFEISPFRLSHLWCDLRACY